MADMISDSKDWTKDNKMSRWSKLEFKVADRLYQYGRLFRPKWPIAKNLCRPLNLELIALYLTKP